MSCLMTCFNHSFCAEHTFRCLCRSCVACLTPVDDSSVSFAKDVPNLLVQLVSSAAHLADTLPQGCYDGRARSACCLQMLCKTPSKGSLHLHRRSSMLNVHFP